MPYKNIKRIITNNSKSYFHILKSGKINKIEKI